MLEIGSWHDRTQLMKAKTRRKTRERKGQQVMVVAVDIVDNMEALNWKICASTSSNSMMVGECCIKLTRMDCYWCQLLRRNDEPRRSGARLNYSACRYLRCLGSSLPWTLLISYSRIPRGDRCDTPSSLHFYLHADCSTWRVTSPDLLPSILRNTYFQPSVGRLRQTPRLLTRFCSAKLAKRSSDETQDNRNVDPPARRS